MWRDICKGTHSPLTILLHWDKGKLGKILITEACKYGHSKKRKMLAWTEVPFGYLHPIVNIIFQWIRAPFTYP